MKGVSIMNRSTRTIINVLSSVFLVVQIVLGITFIFLIFGALEIFTKGLSKTGPKPTINHLDLSFLTQQQFTLLILLLAFIFLAGIIVLFQFLRILLKNLTKGEVFSDYNLTYIRRIMMIYLVGGILDFIFKTFPISYTSSDILAGPGNLIIGLFQVFMMASGIYTLYFVFKYGIELKKDSETII